MNSSKRKVALVTGASSGIGETICWELARIGFTVVGSARRGDRLQVRVSTIIIPFKFFSPNINFISGSVSHLQFITRPALQGLLERFRINFLLISCRPFCYIRYCRYFDEISVSHFSFHCRFFGTKSKQRDTLESSTPYTVISGMKKILLNYSIILM